MSDLKRYFMEVDGWWDTEKSATNHKDAVYRQFENARSIDMYALDTDIDVGLPYIHFKVVDSEGAMHDVKVFDPE